MRYKRIVKQPFWRLIQKPALKRCHCFHATSSEEYEQVRRLDLRAPVAVIPNGVDIPELDVDAPRKRQVVFLGRVNPVKGIDMLIRAWAGICGQIPGWELVIAGPLNDDYGRSMQRLAAAGYGHSTVRFTGEVVGEEKADLLSGATLFVLPSHSENFGMVIAEALAYGLPVITTTGTPWTQLASRRCGWRVTPDESAIATALREAMARPAGELREMGSRGREWMEQEYSWAHIAAMMQETYRWLLNDSPQPGWVHAD
jgi:glycosyltransferase involved in cell wall biosynthesis